MVIFETLKIFRWVLDMDFMQYGLQYQVNLQYLFRWSMMSLAMLNVVLVTDNIVGSGGKVSPTLVMAATFQVG